MVSNRNGNDGDNLPPTHAQDGVKKGGPSEHGDPSSSSNIHNWIHGLERDAYHALFEAFIAQSKPLTRIRLTLMSNLRKELRIADEEHQQMLKRVGNDGTLATALTWRRTEENPSLPPPLSPADPESQKKKKVSHGSLLAPPLKPHPHPSIVTSNSEEQGLPTQKMQPNVKGNVDAIESNVGSKGMPRSNVGRRGKRECGPTLGRHLKSARPSIDESWVGRSLRIRWWADKILYKVVILGYDMLAKMHRVAYAHGTPEEATEWIDLTKMGANDIEWLDNAIDPTSQVDKDHVVDIPTQPRLARGFRQQVEKLEGKRPSDKSLQATCILQSTIGRRETLVEVDNNGTQIKYLEVARLVEAIDALEHEKDLEKLKDGKLMVEDYKEMLQKALVMVTNFSIDGESIEDDDSSKDGNSSDDCEVDNNGTQVKYPEVARLVKVIDALEHEKDLEKLKDGKRMVRDYEEMLQKALGMVTNFSIDGESIEDDDSSKDGNSNDDCDLSKDGDSNLGDNSNADDDSSTDDDSSGSEVSYGHTFGTKLDHIEDNGDNDDYIEID